MSSFHMKVTRGTGHAQQQNTDMCIVVYASISSTVEALRGQFNTTT